MQPGRHHRQRADVSGHVLPGPPVAAGGRAHQKAVLVDEVDRQTVNLQFAQPGVHLGVTGGSGRPGLEFGAGEDIVEREHPFQVLHRGEQGREGPGDLLGRRIRGAKLRVAGLDLRQLVHEPVVLGVGDGRGIQDVVAVGVLVQITGQLRRAGPHLGRNLGNLGGIGGIGGIGVSHQRRIRRTCRVAHVCRARGVQRAHAESSASARPASRQRRSAALA